MLIVETGTSRGIRSPRERSNAVYNMYIIYIVPQLVRFFFFRCHIFFAVTDSFTGDSDPSRCSLSDNNLFMVTRRRRWGHCNVLAHREMEKIGFFLISCKRHVLLHHNVDGFPIAPKTNISRYHVKNTLSLRPCGGRICGIDLILKI